VGQRQQTSPFFLPNPALWSVEVKGLNADVACPISTESFFAYGLLESMKVLPLTFPFLNAGFGKSRQNHRISRRL
jgi:hypothetical protein